MRSAIEMKENGFEYVDLGLPSGTMWATCNVGADKPEDYGLLFQFGRVDGYAYGDSNNQFRTQNQNNEDTGNSYIPLTTSGRTYNESNILNLEDDAASVNMGGVWRMPTNSDIAELYSYATHKVETISEVQGMMFTSKSNENRLFIPFNKDLWDDGAWKHWGNPCAYLWSSQVHNSYVNNAYILSCGTNNVTYINAFNTRNKTFPIRGVF